MFDLNQLDTHAPAMAGRPMPILDPRSGNPIYDADGKPVEIVLFGRNSDVYREVMRSVQQRRNERRMRNLQQTEDEIRQDDFEVIVACTKGWNIPMLDGQPFPFSRENARKLWSDRRFNTLFERASRCIVDDANFLAMESPVSSGGPSDTSS